MGGEKKWRVTKNQFWFVLHFYLEGLMEKVKTVSRGAGESVVCERCEDREGQGKGELLKNWVWVKFSVDVCQESQVKKWITLNYSRTVNLISLMLNAQRTSAAVALGLILVTGTLLTGAHLAGLSHSYLVCSPIPKHTQSYQSFSKHINQY